MQVWHGYTGRYVVGPSGKAVWESASAQVENQNLPAVGQWFFGTDASGNGQQVLMVKIYDSPEEAKREFDRQKSSGGSVLYWNPRERSWRQEISEQRAQGCGGCVHRMGR